MRGSISIQSSSVPHMKFGNRPWPRLVPRYQSAQLRQSQSYGTWMNSASITVHTSRVHGRKLQITMDDWNNHRADRAWMHAWYALVKRYSASVPWNPPPYYHTYRYIYGMCVLTVRFSPFKCNASMQSLEQIGNRASSIKIKWLIDLYPYSRLCHHDSDRLSYN